MKKQLEELEEQCKNSTEKQGKAFKIKLIILKNLLLKRKKELLIIGGDCVVMKQPVADKMGIFGVNFMTPTDMVIKKLGRPDKKFFDDDDRQIYTYNKLKTHFWFKEISGDWRFVKYECADPDVVFEDIFLKEYSISDMQFELQRIGYDDFEIVEYLTYYNMEYEGLSVEYNYGEFYAVACCMKGVDFSEQ